MTPHDVEGGRDSVGQGTISNRAMELIVALLFMAISVLVMWDNWRIGARWASDGPQAGYFPFYIGLIMFIASAVTFCLHAFGANRATGNFVGRTELSLVLKVLIPTIIFVASIGYLGIYVAAALFIAFFMAWLGKYRIHKILPVAVLVPLLLFFMFEVWFLVPLPKGPLEAALGY